MSTRPIWEVPKLWPGSTIFIIGGGPSLQLECLESIRDQRIIAVNQAFRSAPFADVLYFGDGQFYKDNLIDIRGFGGLIVSSYAQIPGIGKGWPGVRRVGRSIPYGIQSEKQGHVAWNNNSGASAINVAYWLGAERIVLLGFDMKPSQGRKHSWHDHYPKRPRNWNPYPRHMIGWPTIHEDAKKLGIEILNCNEDSAIKEFPIVALKDII